MKATGYLHPSYAESLSEFGTPRPYSGGWVLERGEDAMGCYPLFTCTDWSLTEELDVVSLTLITDPFGSPTGCFDIVRPFREHYIADLSKKDFVTSHHKRYAEKAQVSVELGASLDDWVRLYDTLITRHDIKGIRKFSRESFAKQFQVPGFVAFQAVTDEVVSILLWYVQGDVAYYHLGASSPLGYELQASFALFWAAINYFKTRYLDFGGGDGGLKRFKTGWSTGTKMSYLYGRIFNHDRYLELSRGFPVTDYFPMYRRGEYE